MGRKNEAARSEPVASAMSRMAGMIVDRIAQRKGPVMPPVPKSAPRCPLGAKSSSPLEKLAIMKSDNVDSAAKVALRPTPSAAEIDSSAGKNETARVGSCEKSIKPSFGEAAKICVFLNQICLKTWTFMPSLSMTLERLFAQVPLRSIRPSIGRLLYLQ
ncbi:hypothetical protein ACFX1Z_040779 [Malus domestica]